MPSILVRINTAVDLGRLRRIATKTATTTAGSPRSTPIAVWPCVGVGLAARRAAARQTAPARRRRPAARGGRHRPGRSPPAPSRTPPRTGPGHRAAEAGRRSPVSAVPPYYLVFPSPARNTVIREVVVEGAGDVRGAVAGVGDVAGEVRLAVVPLSLMTVQDPRCPLWAVHCGT